MNEHASGTFTLERSAGAASFAVDDSPAAATSGALSPLLPLQPAETRNTDIGTTNRMRARFVFGMSASHIDG
jgi:hypothetical protein